MKKFIPATLIALFVALFVGMVTSPAQADSALVDQINRLTIAVENETGYDRSQFNHWIDADKDGCDTRAEVLLVEAIAAPTIEEGCKLTGGKWYSYYDGATWSDASDVDIDHLVALREAWGSGAYDWTKAQREAYANDLDLASALVAVTDNVNSSKGDKDPAEWLPNLGVCRYASEWVSVKTKWKLTIDADEKYTLLDIAQKCEPAPEPTIEPTTGPTATPTPTPTPTPATTPATTPTVQPTPGGGATLPVTGTSGLAILGGALFLLAIGVFVYYLTRQRRFIS